MDTLRETILGLAVIVAVHGFFGWICDTIKKMKRNKEVKRYYTQHPEELERERLEGSDPQ